MGIHAVLHCGGSGCRCFWNSVSVADFVALSDRVGIIAFDPSFLYSMVSKKIVNYFSNRQKNLTSPLFFDTIKRERVTNRKESIMGKNSKAQEAEIRRQYMEARRREEEEKQKRQNRLLWQILVAHSFIKHNCRSNI